MNKFIVATLMISSNLIAFEIFAAGLPIGKVGASARKKTIENGLKKLKS